MSGVEVITFGCRLNTYESEVMRAEAEKAGLNNAILVNTCAVTGEAVRQARQAIRKARRERPDAKVIVTGCAAQIDPAAFAGMAEVDLVLGNAEKSQAGAYSAAAPEGRVRVINRSGKGKSSALPSHLHMHKRQRAACVVFKPDTKTVP